MNKSIKNWSAFIIILAFTIFINRCNSSNDQVTTPSLSETVIIHDTIQGDSIPYLVYVGVPFPDTVYSIDSVQLIPDTAAILSDYFQIRKYSDTIRRDSSILVIINDSLTRNRLCGRSVFFQNLRPIAITHTTITKMQLQAHSIFAGGNIGGSLVGRFSFSPSLAYSNKQGRMLSLQYDVINKELRAGYYFKIQ